MTVSKTERNEEMLDLVLKGCTLLTVGNQYGVSKERVRQIVGNVGEIRKQAKEEKERNKPTREDKLYDSILNKMKVNKNGCWEIGKAGFRKHTTIRNKTIYLYRFMFEYKYGKIPDDLCACHKCDNPNCVNPEHIFIGTMADNMHDRDTKGRFAMPFLGKHHTDEAKAKNREIMINYWNKKKEVCQE